MTLTTLSFMTQHPPITMLAPLVASQTSHSTQSIVNTPIASILMTYTLSTLPSVCVCVGGGGGVIRMTS
jgi:hypothetical protein